MQEPYLIDCHTHVQLRQFDEDRNAVIARTKEKNIWVVNVGVDYESSVGAIRLAREQGGHAERDLSRAERRGFFATVGLHPNDTQEEQFEYEKFKSLANDASVVAIGETGLDYYRIKNKELGIRNEEKPEVKNEEEVKRIQKEVFAQHIQLANKVGKPLMIHCRSAFADLIDILKTERSQLKADAGVIHFFSGTMDDARALLDLGFSFTFGGVLTFTHDYDEVVKFIPLDRLLLETDAPFVAPTPYRGKRNEPVYIIETAKQMVALKNVSLEELAAQTTTNARTIFRI